MWDQILSSAESQKDLTEVLLYHQLLSTANKISTMKTWKHRLAIITLTASATWARAWNTDCRGNEWWQTWHHTFETFWSGDLLIAQHTSYWLQTIIFWNYKPTCAEWRKHYFQSNSQRAQRPYSTTTVYMDGHRTLQKMNFHSGVVLMKSSIKAVMIK